MNHNPKHQHEPYAQNYIIKQLTVFSPAVIWGSSVPPGKLMGPQPLPWGSSSTMKMLFLQSLQRPKWAASHVALNFSTRGLSTAQWSVTTAASIDDMPTTITTEVILTLVACSSNMLLLDVQSCKKERGVFVSLCVRVPVFAHVCVCQTQVSEMLVCMWLLYRWNVWDGEDRKGRLCPACF